MQAIERLGKAGLIPVVVVESVEDALQCAKALLDAGLDVMEITMRTSAGIDAIRAVSEAYPSMLTGAGTVLTVEKAKEAVDAGAQFIVSPGFSPEVVAWCIDNQVPVTPGCVTPSEITQALSYGLKVLKFFPADVYGGIKGCKALYGPFQSANVRFIPTGGINNDNLAEFADKPFIHAIGGGFLCNPADVKKRDFAAITTAAQKAISTLLGFELAHIGINARHENESMDITNAFSRAFGFGVKEGNSSNFAGTGIEVNKAPGLGEKGHIAIRTNSIDRASYYLQKRGFEVDMDTAKYKGDKMIAVYLKDELGGFAVHLLQK